MTEPLIKQVKYDDKGETKRKSDSGSTKRHSKEYRKAFGYPDLHP